MVQTANQPETSFGRKAAGTGIHTGLGLSGKYMTFKLADEVYGLEILKVREIIGMMDITRVPRTANFIRGVINLRGKVIPVMDLRRKFCMEPMEATDQTVIIVVQLSTKEEGDFTMGILVDEVLEVLFIKGDQIEPPPNFGTNTIDQEFILGVGKADKRVIFLLDIAKVLSSGELLEISSTVSEVTGAISAPAEGTSEGE